MNSPDQRQLHDLLTNAVPDLPEPPDRIGAVARRVAKARARRYTAVAALVLVASGSAFAAQSLRTQDTLSPAAVASLPATAPACPPTFDPDTPPRNGGEPGVLATDGAIRATLCAYPFEASTVQQWTVLTADVSELVDTFNDLPDYATLRRENPNQAIDACLAIGRTQYRIILEYADRSPATIDVSLNCGTATRGNVIRYRNVTAPLRKFAELYNDHPTGPPLPTDRW